MNKTNANNQLKWDWFSAALQNQSFSWALGVKKMIQGTCLEIHTKKFPILPDEKEEIVNEGMYGKALCQYLEKELPKYQIGSAIFSVMRIGDG